MTFNEILQQYLAAGGQLYPQQTGDGSGITPDVAVTLPDGSQAVPDGNGGIVVRRRDGGREIGANYTADGQVRQVDQPYQQNDWRGSLRNAVTTIGGAALAGNAGGLLGLEAAGPAASSGSTGLLGSAPAVTAADITAAVGTPELGLVANPATAAAATAGGVPEGLLTATGAATPAQIATGTTTATAPATGAPSPTSAPVPAPPGGPNVGGANDWLSTLSRYGGPIAATVGAAAGAASNGDLTSVSQQTNNTASQTTGQTDMRANSTGQSSQSLAPWLQPYAQDYLSRSRELANAPTTNATIDAARQRQTDLVANGNPLVNQAQQQQASLISGSMLNANPYIDQVASSIGQRMGDAYATGTRAGTFSAFNGDGNSVLSKSGFGQTLGNQDRAFGDSLGSTLNNLYYGNYQGERQAQDAASRNSLAFGQYDANNAQSLYNTGQQDWQRPFAANSAYGNSINPAFGSQNTSQNQSTGQNNTNQFTNTNQTGTNTVNAQGPSDWLAALGGAAGAYGTYRNIVGTGR
jgi:hypothetical protein